MNAAWHGFLEQSGAHIESDIVLDFGHPESELRAAGSGSVLADLSHLGAIEFAGEDAETFLQGQLSCDLKAIAPGCATLGGYCSPKGRMLADFFLARGEDRLLMILPRSQCDFVQKRLRMFVLRSRVRVSEGTGVLLGVAGPGSGAALRACFGKGFRPGVQPGGEWVLQVPHERSILLVSAKQAEDAWKALSATLRPVGSPCWQWLDIRGGIPMIVPATQDKLVPQMANLELIGGVSFAKGCYTGQEVVARAQYLGKVKRRMFLARLPAEAVPQAGDDLYSDDLGDQASGLVVDAQLSPDGVYDLLAVAQVSSKETSTVHLKAPGGPALQFVPLPYEVT